MHKTLPKPFTGQSHLQEAAAPDEMEEKTLKELMQELNPHLDHAAKDLLQPRPEAVRHLLKKALG